MNKTAVWFMIICSMLIMQWHGAHFWKVQTGDWVSGVGISFCLEVAMLSLWYTGRGWFLWSAKYVAAFLLIAGPWYQITAPMVESLYLSGVTHAEIETVQERVTQLSASMVHYERNSAGRTGWAKRIDRTQSRLDEARNRLISLRVKAAEHGPVWRGYAVAGMQALALLIVLTAQLAAVTSLRYGTIT